MYNDHFGGGPVTTNGYYLAKNIGLVNKTVFSPYWGWDYEIKLTDHYIAPH
jgi:hypothetical protein